MRSSRVLIVLLLLATVLVDVVVLTAAWSKDSPSRSEPDPLIILAWALWLSQVNSAGIWLGLGRSPFPLRSACTVLAIAAWSAGLSALSDPNTGLWAVALTVQSCVIGIPLLALRSSGLCLVEASVPAEVDGPADRRPRMQFSIRYMLGCMTALAVVLGTLHYIAPENLTDLHRLASLSFIMFIVGHTAIGLASLWAVLGTRRPTERVLTLALVGSATFATFWFFGEVNPAFLWRFVVFLCLEILLMVAMLGVFRIAGYRLHWRGSGHSSGESTIEHTTHTIVGGDSSRRS
ncbi:MAG: hypothetical protein A2V70_04405 [Planctomycetes bacterium RBG_13_63_9]|nr:MAG: hypothetical protein A2V70_04405 [Planctomycetes bacterium RBG_13_63_9]